MPSILCVFRCHLGSVVSPVPRCYSARRRRRWLLIFIGPLGSPLQPGFCSRIYLYRLLVFLQTLAARSVASVGSLKRCRCPVATALSGVSPAQLAEILIYFWGLDYLTIDIYICTRGFLASQRFLEQRPSSLPRCHLSFGFAGFALVAHRWHTALLCWLRDETTPGNHVCELLCWIYRVIPVTNQSTTGIVITPSPPVLFSNIYIFFPLSFRA